MRLVFADGWPYRQPMLYVEGIISEHVNNAGEVCLWQPGAQSRGWLTLSGLYERIEEWVAARGAGFPNDGVLDAHLYFDPHFEPGIATVELGQMAPRRRGQVDRIYGHWPKERHLELTTRRRDGLIEGRWYFAETVEGPPRNIEEVRALLTPSQAESLDAGLHAVERAKADRLLLLVWETSSGTNALTLIQRLVNGKVEVNAIETAPTDREYLVARAGPDFPVLQDKVAVIFGVGAIGSHLAVRLAECGAGKLVLRDGDQVRPGNVVRHAAERLHIGWMKTHAVKAIIEQQVPWTEVETGFASWNPDEVSAALSGCDIAVDATGNGGFADLLSDVCKRAGKPLVSVALYRGGSVGRIRRQAAPADTAICERDVGNDPRYPLIPPGDESLSAEPGCSALVNNAPPSAVVAVAARATEIVVDALTAKFAYADELIEIFRPLKVAPFDRVGTVRVEP